MNDVIEYIDGLELPKVGHHVVLRSPPDEVPVTGASAAIAGGSILSFVAGLSQQAREDVLNSTLLMQLAASKRYNKSTEREEWFKFYTEGLGKLGWTLSSQEMERYTPNQQAFTMDDVVLDIMEHVAGGSSFTPIARRTFESLRKQPALLDVFINHSNDGNVGTFQIMPCTQNASGDVTMLLSCMQLVRNVRDDHILFFTFQKNDVLIYRSAQTSVLNSQVYSKVREAVLEKLGQHANQFVNNLSL